MNPYTDEQYAISQFFANTIGALVNASIVDDNMQKESIIALLMKEITKYTLNEDNKINIETALPILKSAEWILSNHKQSMVNDAPMDISETDIYKLLDKTISNLNDYINIYNK